MVDSTYARSSVHVPLWARAFLTVLTVLLALVVARDLFGEEGAAPVQGDCVQQVWYGAQQLQPWYRRAAGPDTMVKRAKVLRDFTDATCAEVARTGIDPLLAVAIAFRESSLLPQVGLGEKNGARGERGYFQVLPGGGAERFAPEGCVSQHDVRCNAATAMSYLAWLRDENCPGAISQWVGAYGRGRCVGPLESREWPEVQVARRHFCALMGSPERCEAAWPE